MATRQFKHRCVSIWFGLWLGCGQTLWAGGGAFNVLVVVNTNSADSIELGNHYAAVHGIPDHHICRVDIATNLVSVTSNEFRSLLVGPITNHIAVNGLAGQIDFLVLCQDVPTRVRNVEGVDSSLFYGFKNAPGTYDDPYGCKLPAYTSNAYYQAERAYRSVDGWNATNGFIAFHLVASNLATAKLVADRGAAAQSSFPAGTAYLFFNGDAPRGVRERLYDRTQFAFTSLPGLPLACAIAPRYTELSGKTNVVGFQDGFCCISPVVRTNNVWLPGAYADHMTSCGGMIPDPCYGQATVLDWMGIGATASYGTVDEPCAYTQKFPDPLLGFYYARGFTIGEAYAMSIAAPYQGLFAGDPLAAPFAAAPMLAVASPTAFQIVTASIPVQVSALARSNGAPAAALDLYLDGRFQTNLATLGPTPGNVLSVTVAGRTNSATVAANATLFDAVAALAAAVNADSGQIVSAVARGDRLELLYENINHAGDNVPVAAAVSQGTAAVLTLGTGLAATSLVPSIYPAREYVELAAHTADGANAGDTITNIVTLANGVAVTSVVVAAQGEQPSALLDRLMNAVNSNPVLMATNGVRYDRLSYPPNDSGCFFARPPGPDGWNIHLDYRIAAISNHSGLVTNSSFASRFDDNADDLRSRASVLFHVAPTNGVLAVETTLDTTELADGIHTLDFIARDGSAVAAQSRFTLPLVVGNASPQLAVLGTNGAAVADNEPPDPAKGTDFGSCEWGTSRTNVLAIRNAGQIPLTIAGWSTNGTGAAAFQFSGIPASVPAGSTADFTVVFAPAATGVFQAALAFASDAVLPQTNILFAGTATARSQTIDFPPIGDQVATSVVALAATASSDLAVEFAVANGPAVLDGTSLTFTNVGTVSVVASQPGNGSWRQAPEVTNTFAIAQAPATVALLDLAQTYSGTARTVSATTDPPNLAMDFTYDGRPVPPTNAGNYAVTGTINEILYSGSATGLLTVAPALLTVTADPQRKAYGTPNPPLTFTYAGFVAGENASALTAEPVAATTVDETTPVGTYSNAIAVSGGLATNYAFQYVAADFTVTEAITDLKITGLASASNDVQVVFGPVAAACSYGLLCSASLTNAAWNSVTSMVAEAAAESATLTHAGGGSADLGYYRIAGRAGPSKQVWGFAKVDKPGNAKLAMVGIPFATASQTLDSLMDPLQFSGHHISPGSADQLMVWEPATQSYRNLALFDVRTFGAQYAYLTGWKAYTNFNSGAPYVNPVLPPGSAVWIRGSTADDRQVAITGEAIWAAAATNAIATGLQLVANPFSETVGLGDLQLHAHGTGHYLLPGAADQIMVWNAGSQSYLNLALYDVVSYFGTNYAYLTGWQAYTNFGSGAPYVSPALPPGQGFWYKAVSNGFDWVEANKYLDALE